MTGRDDPTPVGDGTAGPQVADESMRCVDGSLRDTGALSQLQRRHDPAAGARSMSRASVVIRCHLPRGNQRQNRCAPSSGSYNRADR